MIPFFNLKELKFFRGRALLEIQLPKCIEARLRRFAKETGRSETTLVKEALGHYLDDLEDVYLSDKVVQRIRNGQEDVVSSAEMAQMLGLKSDWSRQLRE